MDVKKLSVRKNLSKAFYTLSYAVFLIVILSSTIVSAVERVFVFPDEGHAPFLRIINGAKHTIMMAAYKFTDETLIDALRAAADRGVKVKLLAENKNIYLRPDESAAEQDLRDPALQLNHPNIKVFRTSERFNQSHYKMIIGDGEITGEGLTAIISTGNFCPDTFSATFEHPYRDFALSTRDPASIGAISKVFEADIADKRIVPEKGNVIWGPDQTREAFLALINGAQKRIDVYQQDVQDVGLAKALAGAARAGLKVRLLMNPFPFGGDKDPNVPNQTMMAEAGVQIMLCDKTYNVMHAKGVIVDGQKMYLGSCNFYTSSLDQTRELGIITQKQKSIEMVMETFEKDWRHGKLFVSPVKNEQ